MPQLRIQQVLISRLSNRIRDKHPQPEISKSLFDKKTVIKAFIIYVGVKLEFYSKLTEISNLYIGDRW